MDSLEEFEERVAKIKAENDKLLVSFSEWLEDKGLASKTIDRHVSNMEFFLNHYLLGEGFDAREGLDEVCCFVGDWFLRKALWANKSTVRSYRATFKKFYKFMLEKEQVDPEDYEILLADIKEEMPMWLEAVENPFWEF